VVFFKSRNGNSGTLLTETKGPEAADFFDSTDDDFTGSVFFASGTDAATLSGLLSVFSGVEVAFLSVSAVSSDRSAGAVPPRNVPKADPTVANPEAKVLKMPLGLASSSPLVDGRLSSQSSGQSSQLSLFLGLSSSLPLSTSGTKLIEAFVDLSLSTEKYAKMKATRPPKPDTKLGASTAYKIKATITPMTTGIPISLI